MSKTILVFGVGIMLALLAVGGYMVSQTFFAGADADSEPQNVVITRNTPTEGSVSFITAKPVIASIECSGTIDGSFEICGSETTATTDHSIDTSMILDPEKRYYFYIKIGNTRFDNLGEPLIFNIDKKDTADKKAFPSALVGVCSDDVKYIAEFDVNNDGCIRLNDRDLYSR